MRFCGVLGVGVEGRVLLFAVFLAVGYWLLLLFFLQKCVFGSKNQKDFRV